MTFCIQSSADAFSTHRGNYSDNVLAWSGLSSTDMVAFDDLGPFHMKKTLYVDIRRIGDGIMLYSDEADLYAVGRDMASAKEDLADELRIAWEEYALCDDDELDPVAREYKSWLLENVEGPE